jgi:hypothetical protein
MFDLATQIGEKVDLFDTAVFPSESSVRGPSLLRHVLDWCPPEPKKIKFADPADNDPGFKLLKAIAKAFAQDSEQNREYLDVVKGFPCQLGEAFYKQVRSAEARRMIKGDHLRLDLDGGVPKIRDSAGINEEWEALKANWVVLINGTFVPWTK